MRTKAGAVAGHLAAVSALARATAHAADIAQVIAGVGVRASAPPTVNVPVVVSAHVVVSVPVVESEDREVALRRADSQVRLPWR